MKYDFTPKGVCSRGIHVELDGDVIRSVKFDGGCSGNTQGVAALAVGMTVDEYAALRTPTARISSRSHWKRRSKSRRTRKSDRERSPGEKLFPGFSLFRLDFSSKYGIII